MNSHNLYSVLPVNDELYFFTKASSAFAYYPTYRINLLNGDCQEYDVLSWYENLDFPVFNHSNKNRIIHLFYELGNFSCLENFNSDLLLAIDIVYEEIQKNYKLGESSPIELLLKKQISIKDYNYQFQKGYDELIKGNCYQFNLTSESLYKFSKNTSPMDFISKLWGDKNARGAYGSATYSDVLKKLFLSNSPECLFNYKNKILLTRPIKGTLKRTSENKKDIKKLWNQLISDKKNQAELFMITDLLRNDLSSIDLPRSKVISQKKILLVPNLIHQYSEIAVELREHISLKKILSSIFPGGSITGAPKKSAMKLINELEKRQRKFYCSSTILLHKGEVSASINIRSSEICFHSYILSYSAGGGITLESDPKTEYLEMSYKIDSYINLLSR